MKWIKKYENFTNDNNRDSNSLDYLPKYNPVINQEAAEYVDSILKSNEFDKLFKLVGVEMPKDIKGDEMDPLFDEVREKAIEYYIEHPEAIGKEISIKQLPGNKQNLSSNSDRLPTTNNIGGTSQTASGRIGESKVNFDGEVEITEDDMNKFNSEEPLIELIRNNKVALNNKKIEFNKSDKKTINTLDIYFEIDKNDLESDEEETKE